MAIDPGAVQNTTIRDGLVPEYLAYDPHLGGIVSLNGGGSVSLFNDSAETVASSVNATDGSSVAVDPASDLLYITTYVGDLLVMNFTAGVTIGTVAVAGSLNGAILASGASTLFLEDIADATIHPLYVGNDTPRPVLSLGTCGYGQGVYAAENDTVLIPSACGPTIQVIDAATDSFAGNVTLNSTPTAVAYDGPADSFWVAESDGGVYEYNATTYRELGSTATPFSIDSLALDPSGFVYAAGHDSGVGSGVAVILAENHSLLESDILAPYNRFVGMGVDPVSGAAWVPGTTGGGGIYILTPTPWPFVFVEAGLATGTSWSVSIDGTRPETTTNSVILGLPDGRYAYRFPPVAGYQIPPGGNVTILGGSSIVHLSFVPYRFAVSFTESGLPDGTPWGIDLAGLDNRSSGAQDVFALPNGTSAYDVDPVPGFQTSWSGVVDVRGTPSSVQVPFIAFRTGVEFLEQGLPVGTNWSVSGGGTVASGTGSTLTFSAANGTFDFAIADVPGWRTGGYTGSVDIAGAPVMVPVSWDPFQYPVNVSITGLPAGSVWWFNLSAGAARVSSTGGMLFTAANGSYSYTLASADRRFQSSSGVFNVDGGPRTLAVSFLPVQYSARFVAVGLPADTSWGVLLDSQAASGTGVLTVSGLANGTYSFAIDPEVGFDAAPSGGTITVDGPPATVVVQFNSSAGAVPPSLFQTGSLSLGLGILGVAAVGVVLAARWRRRRPAAGAVASLEPFAR